MQNTICALATGTAGAVAIVRLSGADSLSILRRITKTDRQFTPRVQTFCCLYDKESVLDKALVTYFQAPNSFTGEDVVEFSVHASSYIKGRLLELLCENGARLANRGEFSQRAFLNGKMDLVEAQGLCDLIASNNKASHKLAIDSLTGKLSDSLVEMRTVLAELLAQIEVRLDDVDEEMTPLSDSFVTEKVESVLQKINKLANTFSVGKLIKDGIKVAIVGCPNSGKSSLLNQLVGFDRAIVSDICGTTRDTVEEMVEINGQKIILTDTAGIRDHVVDYAEKEGIKRSRKAIKQADKVLFVLDSTRPLNQEEIDLYSEIKKDEKPVLAVFNKQDVATNFTIPDMLSEIFNVKISCKTNTGLTELMDWLTKDVDEAHIEDGVMVSNLRHYEGLVRAQIELEELLIKQRQQMGGEILAEHLRRALLQLKDLIGEVTPDDVLGIIFSKFCMGK